MLIQRNGEDLEIVEDTKQSPHDINQKELPESVDLIYRYEDGTEVKIKLGGVSKFKVDIERDIVKVDTANNLMATTYIPLIEEYTIEIVAGLFNIVDNRFRLSDTKFEWRNIPSSPLNAKNIWFK